MTSPIKTRRDRGLIIFGSLLIAGSALGGVWLLQSTPSVPTPERVLPAATAVASAPPSNPAPSSEPEAPTNIDASDILNVAVPAVALDVKVSGQTQPRQTENCKATTVCIDPPVADEAAWYGDVPSAPSSAPVRLFGHTSQTNAAYATFNGLVNVLPGDEIIVTTETGVFTYVTDTVTLVPYEEVPDSQLVYGDALDSVVLVTCNKAADSATVVSGHLMSAATR